MKTHQDGFSTSGQKVRAANYQGVESKEGSPKDHSKIEDSPGAKSTNPKKTSFLIEQIEAESKLKKVEDRLQ